MMAPSVEESLDVLKQALHDSLVKAEEAIDLHDGEAIEVLRQSEREKQELQREVHELRAEVSRLQDAQTQAAPQSWLPWNYWCVSCTPNPEAELQVLRTKCCSRG
mmetsp:Transcript_6270/g.14216  ORF Transcript_6270/g.14216 Transcript_6270/m.14216 type:complete len:105 (+) Transcript_6270:54-368(+)